MLNTIGMFALSAAAAATAARVSPDIMILYMPLNVVVAACAGALAAFAFSSPLPTRGKVFTVAFSSVVLGCATAVIIETIAHNFKWVIEQKALAAMALILSFLARWFWPAVIERIGPFLDRIPFFKKEK